MKWFHVLQEAIESGEVEVRQEGSEKQYFFVEHITGNEEELEMKKVAERPVGKQEFQDSVKQSQLDVEAFVDLQSLVKGFKWTLKPAKKTLAIDDETELTEEAIAKMKTVETDMQKMLPKLERQLAEADNVECGSGNFKNVLAKTHTSVAELNSMSADLAYTCKTKRSRKTGKPTYGSEAAGIVESAALQECDACTQEVSMHWPGWVLASLLA
eukprot:6461246-Amphidinium_carterae.2